MSTDEKSLLSLPREDPTASPGRRADEITTPNSKESVIRNDAAERSSDAIPVERKLGCVDTSPADEEERMLSSASANHLEPIRKRFKSEKDNEPFGPPPPSSDVSTSARLMNKSVGSFTVSSSSPSPQNGTYQRYLCIPIDSKGNTIPSEAFLSPTLPGRINVPNGNSRISPMGSSSRHCLSTDARANLHRRACSDSRQMFTPDSPARTARFEEQVAQQSQTRQVSDILENRNPSPISSESKLRFRKEFPKPIGPGPRRYAFSPTVQTPTPSPVGSAEQARNSNSVPVSHRRVFLSDGRRNVAMPLSSVVPRDAIDDLSKGTKRVVLARNGTPIAFVGNTLEVLSQTATPVDEQRKWQRWTDSEDEILRCAVEKEGTPHNWKRISRKYFIGVRSDTQCKNRWKKALQPGLIRGCWTADEDKVILESMEKGMKFSDIARLLPGRIAEQVKERWVNTVDPSLNKGDWTDAELEILFQAQAKLGNQWKKIAAQLPGRSENHVKNRWYNAKMAQRRKMKRLAAEAEATERLERARDQYLVDLKQEPV